MKIFMNFLILVISLASFTSLADTHQQSGSSDTIQLGTWAGPPMTLPDGTGLLNQLMTEAFKRCCNLKAKVTTLPPARSLRLANQGKIDGELPRLIHLSAPNSIYPNLLIVDVPSIPLAHVAMTKDPNIHISNWDELEPYNVGHISGWKLHEKNTRKYKSLTIFDDKKTLFTALNKGRIDVFIYDRLSGLMEIERMGLTGIYGSNSPRFETGMYKMYPYMHKKHKHLVPKLKKALIEMLGDRTYEKIYCQTLFPYLPAKDSDKLIMNALSSIGAKHGKACADIAQIQ